MTNLRETVSFLGEAVESLAEMDDFKAQYAKSQHAKLSRGKEIDAKRSSSLAAGRLAKVFQNSGWKADPLSTDGWGITPVSLDIDGVRIPVSIGVQELPKQSSFHLQFQQPMSGLMSDKRDGRWRELSKRMMKALEYAASAKKLKEFGKVNVELLKGAWPQVWVYPSSEEDFQHLLPVFPMFVSRAANAVARTFANSSELFIDGEGD